MLKLKEYKLNRCKCGKAPKLTLKESFIEPTEIAITCKCHGIKQVLKVDTQAEADRVADNLTQEWNRDNTHDGIY